MDSNHDLLAERAGICVKFPGKSEYAGSFEAKKLTRDESNMYIRPDQMRDHLIRARKYEYGEKKPSHLGVTGESEVHSRFTWSSANDENISGKVRVTRSDFDRNPFFNRYPPYLQGRTEYTDRYEKKSGEHDALKTTLVVNPRVELEKGSQGRQMASSAQVGFEQSVYTNTFKWPQNETRDKFTWLK